MGEFRCGPHAGAPAPARQARALECSPETALTLVAREGEASPHTVGAFVFHSEPREHIWCYSLQACRGRCQQFRFQIDGGAESVGRSDRK